jgi:phage protein D
MAAIDITLRLGTGTVSDAPREVIAALARVEVRRGDAAPAGFELTFDSHLKGSDVALLSNHFADPFTRVVITATVQGMPDPSGSTSSMSAVLIDGYVTAQDLVPETGDAGGTLVVTGEDASVMMDMVALSTEYPSMNDAAIVQQILGRYASLVTASVTAPDVDPVPTSFVPQQNATDLAYLRHLARRHGALFYIVPDSDGATAYWGPPKTAPAALHALTVGAGADGNVSEIRFRRGALAPTVTYGAVLDTTTEPPSRSPVAIGAASRSLGYAATAALTGGAGLANDPMGFSNSLSMLRLRGSLFRHAGLDVGRAKAVAQAQTDRSTLAAVTATGVLDTIDYGGLLLAPGMVEVRGSGDTYDGKYYVAEVAHVIEFGDEADRYTQQFTLTRDGVGATIDTVIA